MRGLLVATFLLVGSLNVQAACDVPSYNAAYSLPTGYTAADAFVGKFDYPAAPTESVPSFLTINYHDDWQAYLLAALDYAYEGNEAVDFKIAANTTRDWYHGIWMHYGTSGREFLRGLTQERASRDHQYKPGLTTSYPTWAIGFYNSFGASTFAKVWADPCQPDLSDVLFPVGTVTFKLLFTTAPDTQLAYLNGSPEWKAHIGFGDPPSARSVQTMRLLQVDIGVRDDRDSKTGWVFGTFVYDKDINSTDKWRRLRPVSLQWGNDPDVNPATNPDGTPVDNLLEGYVNQDWKGTLFGWDERKSLGWGGRSNGPADNLLSSCLSCHGTAQFPRSDDYNNFARDPPTDIDKHRLVYFRNLKPGEIFDAKSKLFDVVTQQQIEVDAFAMDYSLQLQNGLERMCGAVRNKVPPFDAAPVPWACTPSEWQATPMSRSPTNEAAARREVESIDWDRFVDAPIR